MIQYGFRLAVVLGLITLSACGPVISSEWRKEARKDLTFDQVLQNPAAYTGSVVIWGGIIISVANRPDGSSLAVLETPLSYRERPESSEYSRGRFIATTPDFLDPAVYGRGRRITVAGEITGKETRPIGKSKVMYAYPVITIKQVVLWSIQPEYPPPDYWWYGGPYDLWRDEGSAPRMRKEEEERGAAEERGERGHEEAGERGAAEHGEGGHK